MHLNKSTIIGKVTQAGPKVTYPSDAGKQPTCSFWVEVTEPGKEGKVFTSYIPVEITGKLAEDVAETLMAGDEVMIDGRLRYKSAGVTKDGKKTGGCVVSSWFVTREAKRSADAQAIESQN